MAERKIELTWVCSSCQHRNRGRDKVCAGCGHPKDASETFEMPADTRTAASVDDPALLRAASAGADWRCAFCRADNTALVRTCKQCGADRGAIPAHVGATAPIAAVGSARPAWPLGAIAIGCALAVVLGAAGLSALLVVATSGRDVGPSTASAPPASSIVQATVVARHWRTTRTVMRRQLVDREGFAEQEPSDAVDVVEDGVRHHHDDRVEDGTEEQTYTEDVPYQDTETYTEMVPCGEDCTTIPPTCHEECTDDGNGFASCHDVCSGGGQSCTPRTCTMMGTRPVTRTRTETRTRTVPRYRSVPRDAPWFRWRAWEWVEARRAAHEGTSEAPTWPTDEELGPGTPLGDGETERVDTDASASVTLADAQGRSWSWQPSLDALASYPVGATVAVELDPYGSFRGVVSPSAGPPASATLPP